ncbi:MAG: DinB family protein [Thermomicrobiales bacterium]
MDAEQRRFLAEQVHTGGAGYVRDLAAAEAAVLSGQFNLAKVLRALAHAQRVQALAAARLLDEAHEPATALHAAATELAALPPEQGQQVTVVGPEAALLTRFGAARRSAQELAARAASSLDSYRDVREEDVAQIVWGCYGCGALVEGALPAYCPVCGALAAEFERFAPFYIATPEHLGQLAPAELVAILAAVPDQVAATVAGVDEATLARKPSAAEWCAREIIGHILETDLLFQRAVRTILAAEGLPQVEAATPPWKLHEGKGYERLPAPVLLAQLRQTRADCLDLIRDLPPDAWVRRGAMRGVTPSLIDLGTWLANHDRGHLAQIQELCQAGAGPAGD